MKTMYTDKRQPSHPKWGVVETTELGIYVERGAGICFFTWADVAEHLIAVAK